MRTLNWIPCDPIWKPCYFRVNITGPLQFENIFSHYEKFFTKGSFTLSRRQRCDDASDTALIPNNWSLTKVTLLLGDIKE